MRPTPAPSQRAFWYCLAAIHLYLALFPAPAWAGSGPRLLVKLRPGASRSDIGALAGAAGRVPIRVSGALRVLPGYRVVDVPVGQTDAVERMLLESPEVAEVIRDVRIDWRAQPNDPKFSGAPQWSLFNTGQAISIPSVADADIDATEAWDITTGDPEFVIAVIDTGVDMHHPDLAANIWINRGEIPDNGLDDDANGYIDDIHGWDFAGGDNQPKDENGHGTHVAGILGASGNNGIGITGVNWRTRILPLRIGGPNEESWASSAVLALEYAVAQGARISNNSYGFFSHYQPFYEALANAREKKHIFFAATSNARLNHDVEPDYPGSYDLDNIVVVAASDGWDELADFSSYGATMVDIAAPGRTILSTYPFGTYTNKSGTSMATPHVTGVLALLLGRYPSMSYREAIDQVLFTGDTRPGLVGRIRTGRRLNAFSALTQGPAAPASLAATILSREAVRLEWADTALTETGYVVERRSGPSGAWQTIAQLGAGSTSHVDNAMPLAAHLYYRVRAFNTVGSSENSNEVHISTFAPAPPHTLSAMTLSTSSIRLSWTDASQDEQGFLIERKLGATGTYMQIASVGRNVTGYTATGLAPDQVHYFRVRAFNLYGNSAYSNERMAPTAFLPSAPSLPGFSVLSQTSVRITWRDNSANESGFRIERRAGAGSYVEIATVGANTTSYTSTGLAPNVTYSYRVRAFNAAGPSAFTAPVSARTSAPAAPLRLTATATSPTTIRLNWADGSSNESGYKIEISRSPTSGFAQVGTVGAGVLSYAAARLARNTMYYFRVRAYNGAGNSPYTSTVSAKTPR